jgi:two-component system, response regulator PdtaR
VEDAGYRAKEASSAGEAIGVLENDPSIRVIITDIGMPETMDGVALAHYVHERWPPTVIVISSAYLPNGSPARPKAACSFRNLTRARCFTNCWIRWIWRSASDGV